MISEALTARLHELLYTRFHLEAFRRGQLDILRSVLAGRDTIGVMPTGGGKSLCYQLPAVFHDGLVIVISPLIALMRDQVAALRALGIRAGAIYSDQNADERAKVSAEVRAGGAFVLFLSPERVQKPGFLEWFARQRIVLFAIDEAHCVSQWGHEFRQDYARLSALKTVRPDVPILALTATATPAVLADISTQLGIRSADRHVYGFYRPNLYSQVETCADEIAKDRLLEAAIECTPSGRILVYCGTRRQTEEVAEQLSRHFAGVDRYHAGLAPTERERCEAAYESGETRILAATNAFGMGIDHADVRLVVHYQMPANLESYYQEMGRAGRDGGESTCLLLYARKDKGLHSYFIRQAEAGSSHVSQRWRSLDAITQFCEGGECRHAGILTYFRDAQRIQSCGHCDVCAPDSPRRVPVPAAVSFPKRSGNRGARASKRDRASESSRHVAHDPLNAAGQLRAEVLQTWRKSYAESLDLPAFLVFSNKTLQAIAHADPRTSDDLSRIYGLGEKKIEAFGKALLEQLAQCRNG